MAKEIVYSIDGVINARINQKTDTEENWLANDLVLLNGEQAFVISESGQSINFKIGDGTKTFSELEYFFDYSILAGNIGSLTPSDPAPTVAGLYIPIVDGTYANAGGLVRDTAPGGVDEGMAVEFIFDGGNWVKNTYPLPASENKIKDWVAGTYPQGAQVNHNGQIWEATTGTSQEPGTGGEWSELVDVVPRSEVDPSIEKTIKAFNLTPDGTTGYVSTKELPVSFYGGSIYGWGFPIGTPGGSFQSLSVRLRNNDSIDISEVELRIKRENAYGQLLATKRQIASIAAMDDELVQFNLDVEITGTGRIWLEIYTDAKSQVYRTGTSAQIFTEANGYPQLATMTGAADLDGNVSGEAGFMDIYAAVTIINKKLEATEELKGIIQNEVKSTPLTEFPETVQDSVSVTDSLFQITGTSEEVYKPTGDLEVSFYGTNTYGWGFHAGVVKNFSKVGIRIKTHQNSTVPITEVEIRVKENDWDGALLAKVRMNVNIPISEDSIITATLPQEISNESGQRIWLEIYTNALSQAYRTGTSAQIFTAENGYTVARRSTSNNLDDEVETTLTYFDFYSEFTRSSKTIELTPLGEQVLKSGASLSGKSVAFLGDSIIMNFSSQYTDHDTQDWIQMQEKLGVSELINCGIGGATWKDRGDANNTSSPQRGTTSAYISNEIRMLKRLITEGRTTPDLIVISAGTNDSNQTDNYDAVMSMTFAQLEADEAIRETLYGGLRYCMEWLMNDFPDSQVIVVTPFQSATGAHRTFENQQEKGDYIKKMAKRFSILVIDQFSECGIVDYYEVDGGNGRYLVDGVHLNDDGKTLITEYLYQNIVRLFNPRK